MSPVPPYLDSIKSPLSTFQRVHLCSRSIRSRCNKRIIKFCAVAKWQKIDRLQLEQVRTGAMDGCVSAHNAVHRDAIDVWRQTMTFCFAIANVLCCCSNQPKRNINRSNELILCVDRLMLFPSFMYTAVCCARCVYRFFSLFCFSAIGWDINILFSILEYIRCHVCICTGRSRLT